METTTTARLKRTGMTAGLFGMVALFSTGCTAAEVDQFVTLLRILGWFI